MSIEVSIDDVLCFAVPEQWEPPAGIDEELALTAFAVKLAKRTVHAQYDSPVRPDIRFRDIDTLVTGSIRKAEKFQPAHDCAECIAGTERTCQYLRENPGRKVALVNIHYTEVWPPGSRPIFHAVD